MKINFDVKELELAMNDYIKEHDANPCSEMNVCTGCQVLKVFDNSIMVMQSLIACTLDVSKIETLAAAMLVSGIILAKKEMEKESTIKELVNGNS